MIRKHEYGARWPISKDAHARPNIDGALHPVSTGGDEDDTFSRLLSSFVDCRLNGSGVIRRRIAVRTKLAARQIHRLGILESCRKHRCSQSLIAPEEQEQNAERKKIHGGLLLPSVTIAASFTELCHADSPKVHTMANNESRDPT